MTEGFADHPMAHCLGSAASVVGGAGSDQRGRGISPLPRQRRGLVADQHGPPFISGDTVIVLIEDEASTIMVKRYRLVLPAERSPHP